MRSTESKELCLCVCGGGGVERPNRSREGRERV